MRLEVSRRLRHLAVAAAASLLALISWGASLAGAAPGDLVFQDCFTASEPFGPNPPGSGSCAAGPPVTSTGDNSGLFSPNAVAVSPEGEWLYAVGNADDSVARFKRDPATGALTYQDCLTGEIESGPGPAGSGACALISTATATGGNSGLDQPFDLVISPDRANLYVSTTGDDSVVRFTRDTGTGVLTFQDCATGETETGPAGTNACTVTVPLRTAFGTDSGFDKIRSLAIDADGENLYASAAPDDNVIRFTRGAGGALSFQECFTGKIATGPLPTGNGTCTGVVTPARTTGGGETGMDNPQSITVSPDGTSLYLASGNDASITHFTRTDVTGALSYAGCITGELQSGPMAMGSGACALNPGATSTPGQPGGGNSGLDNLRSVAVSPDNASLYVVSSGDAALARFDRTPGAGTLLFQGCLTGDADAGPAPGTGACTNLPTALSGTNGSDSGLGSPQDVLVSPDGGSVFVTGQVDDTVARFSRAGDGAIAFGNCVSGDLASGALCTLIPFAGGFTGLDGVRALDASPDGKSLYSIATNAHALARFGFEQAPLPILSPPPQATRKRRCRKGKKLVKRKGKRRCVRKKKKKRR